MLLLFKQHSGNREQVMNSNSDSSCSWRVRTIKEVGKRSPSSTLNWRGAQEDIPMCDTPMGQHRQVTKTHCWQQQERAEGT